MESDCMTLLWREAPGRADPAAAQPQEQKAEASANKN